LSKPKALKLAGDPAEVPGAPAEATVELSIKHNLKTRVWAVRE